MLDDDVLRLDVAMDDSVSVGVCERPEQLDADRARNLRGERPLDLKDLAERTTAEELDNQILLVFAFRGDIVDLHDVRVTQLGDGLRLDREPPRDLPRVPEVRVNHLHGDVATEPFVVGPIHRGHAAVPKLVEHLVLRQTGEASRARRLTTYRRHRFPLYQS
jgi:hypothetical protein